MGGKGRGGEVGGGEGEEDALVTQEWWAPMILPSLLKVFRCRSVDPSVSVATPPPSLPPSLPPPYNASEFINCNWINHPGYFFFLLLCFCFSFCFSFPSFFYPPAHPPPDATWTLFSCGRKQRRWGTLGCDVSRRVVNGAGRLMSIECGAASSAWIHSAGNNGNQSAGALFHSTPTRGWIEAGIGQLPSTYPPKNPRNNRIRW